jgi:hypothetical protein
MTTLHVDGPWLEALRQVKRMTEVCDPDGNLLGYFAPLALRESISHLIPVSKRDLPDLERRKANTAGAMTTRELFEFLKSITPEPEWRDHLQQHIDRLAERERCDAP